MLSLVNSGADDIFILHSSNYILNHPLSYLKCLEPKDIDDESQAFFNELREKYGDLFMPKKTYDHSKMIICDSEFMIIGSFNWLSFGGKDEGGNATREETSTINKNAQEIAKEQEKFRPTLEQLKSSGAFRVR